VLEKDSAHQKGFAMPKTMHREWDRLNRLNHLYGKDGRVVCAGEVALSTSPRARGEVE
jgi:hypothetical protein